jgi:hypothetical protein
MARLFCMALLLLAAPLAAAPVPKSLKKHDLSAQMVGTWKPNGTGSAWFQFNADGTLKTWHANGNARNSEMQWTWVIDPEPSTPQRVKLSRTSEPRQSLDCALELDGDTLTFAFLTGGKKLPEKLADGQGLELYHLARTADGK